MDAAKRRKRHKRVRLLREIFFGEIAAVAPSDFVRLGFEATSFSFCVSCAFSRQTSIMIRR